MECLVQRNPAALPVPGIVRRVRGQVDFGFDQDAVAGALAMLVEMKLVVETPDELGSSMWYRASAEGVVWQERKKSVERGA